MTTKTREPKTLGDALWMSPYRGWHFVTRGVGIRFSLEDVKAYCREHAASWTPGKPWHLEVDHQIFSEPGVKRGDWLTWFPDKPDELLHEHEWHAKSLSEALACYKEEQTRESLHTVEEWCLKAGFTEAKCFMLREDMPISECLIWEPDRSELKHWTWTNVDLKDATAKK